MSGTVLITGATGQVGNAIARRLAGDGVEVRALVRSPERAEVLPEGAQPVFGDVTDAASLQAALDGCGTVYHAAGHPRAVAPRHRRVRARERRGDAQRRRGGARGAASSGSSTRAPTTCWCRGPASRSTSPSLNPNPGDTPYQRSKQEADRIVTAALDRGLPAVFLHPAGVYGPAPFLVKGFNDLLMELAKRKTPMLLPGGMGGRLQRGRGRRPRAGRRPRPRSASRYLLAESFQSLTDIARAVAAAEPRAKVPRVMPFAVARAVSTAGEGVARVTGRPPLISRSVLQFLERGSRPSGARARAELGWSPTPFTVGVERTLAHFRQQGWL